MSDKDDLYTEFSRMVTDMSRLLGHAEGILSQLLPGLMMKRAGQDANELGGRVIEWQEKVDAVMNEFETFGKTND